jgi:hypothetical protein
MDLERHLELAIRIVKEGVPFCSEDGVFGVRKGTMSVHLEDGKLHLACGSLIPIELQKPQNPEVDEKFKRIRSHIEEMRAAWFST